MLSGINKFHTNLWRLFLTFSKIDMWAYSQMPGKKSSRSSERRKTPDKRFASNQCHHKVSRWTEKRSQKCGRNNNSNKKSKIYYQSSDDISSNLATSANCSVNNLHRLTAAKEGLHQTVNSFIIHIIHHVDTKSNILTKYIDVLWRCEEVYDGNKLIRSSQNRK